MDLESLEDFVSEPGLYKEAWNSVTYERDLDHSPLPLLAFAFVTMCRHISKTLWKVELFENKHFDGNQIMHLHFVLNAGPVFGVNKTFVKMSNCKSGTIRIPKVI